MSERIFINKTAKREALPGATFHKVMLFFQRPVMWPGWVMATAVAALAVFVGSIWYLLNAPLAVVAGMAIVQMLFFAGDTAVLLLLPHRRISFGDWRAQFFPLALPRSLATTLTAFAGLLLGWPAAVVLALAAQLLGTVLLVWAAAVEPARLSLTRLEVTSDRLPSGTPPIQLLHISDLHIERLSQREERILELVEHTQPDLIVISGDYVSTSNNRDREAYRQIREFLGKLQAPYGVYATLGTPLVDLREWVAPLFDGLPITLMREAWQKVDLDKGRQLVLMGMDCTHNIPHDAASLERLVAQAPNGAPQVLVYHSPELMPQASAQEIDLYLCGHTHGGQVRLPLVGAVVTSSQLGRQYVMGLYRNGRTHLYVSRGVGLEGLSAPRVRLLAPPEVTLVTIRSTW